MSSLTADHKWREAREIEEIDKDSRLASQVDRDRVLYSTALARLAEITQVVSADHGYVFHNRLTHSMKVAQLSRRIAEYLLANQSAEVARAGGLDADAAETAGLAHDLGHPPFGHIAEEELDEAIKEIDASDGYEGNAQSFRLVSKLMVGDPIREKSSEPLGPGLNLTRASLNGILKYPWMINGNPAKPAKWGAYLTEKSLFDWVRKDFDTEHGAMTKSLEAEVMDWADDITYAVHDVVDFYCAGKIPLERLADSKSVELSQFLDEVFSRQRNAAMVPNRTVLERCFNDASTLFFKSIDERYTGSVEQKKTLWHMMTSMIGRYVEAIKVGKTPDGKHLVTIDSDAKNEIDMLKQLTWHYVILNTDLATVQHGQKVMVRHVFDTFFKVTTKQPESKLLPRFYEELIKKAQPSEKIRLVADCVSSMTEAEICTIFNKLAGFPKTK